MGLFDGKVATRHGRGARHRSLRVPAPRERGRAGRGQRPRRLGRGRGRRQHARPAGRRRDQGRRAAKPSPTTTTARAGAGGEAHGAAGRSTPSVASTCSSATPGILRDKMSFNMSEEEFDAVIRVHLKGHFAPIRFAASYWRTKAKETGEPANAADRHHRVGVGSLRQRGPDQLRRGQGRHREHDDRARPRARALGRAGQLHRAGRGHAPARHRRHAASSPRTR